MKYYVLDTKEESDECRKYCLEAFLSNKSGPAYLNQTTQWSEEQQRLTDEKYIVPVCPQLGTFGYSVENSSEDWFPPEEETIVE